MYASHSRYAFEHPTSIPQPFNETLIPRVTYETPTTILSRLSTSTPHAHQQQPQVYYYYHDDPRSSSSDHLEYRAAPLGFSVKKPKGQVHVDHFHERVYVGQVDSSWPDVPTSGQRPQYKDQSTQTDPMTMTVEEIYAAVIAHEAQQEIIESSTQESSRWTGGSGVEVDSLVGSGSDEASYPSGELGGFGVKVDLNATSSGSTYSFPLPTEGIVQRPSSSGMSGDGDMTAMGTNLDSLDPLDPAAVMEMAILEGWADMDFGLLGASTEVEADTVGTIDPARIDWLVGQPMQVEGGYQAPPPASGPPSYSPVEQSVKKVRRSRPASPAKPKNPKRVGRPRKEPTQVIEPFPYGLPTEYNNDMRTSVFTDQSLTYAEVDQAQRERASLAGE